MPDLGGFIQRLGARGIEIDPIDVLADGHIHRVWVTTARRHRRRNGWYVLFQDDGLVGVFGRHDDGLGRETWVGTTHETVSPEERARRREIWMRRARDERARRATSERKAAELAAKTFAAAVHNVAQVRTHAYLTRKHVRPHGIALDGADLLIPIRNEAGHIMSLQRIAPDGSKWFLAGGRVAGGYHSVGGPPTGRHPYLLIAEGYATAATLRESTGRATIAAFNCGNLVEVARAARRKYPHAIIVMCADDDWKVASNPGLSQARLAATTVRGIVAVPVFPVDQRLNSETDFNDLERRTGRSGVADCVRRAIQDARKSQMEVQPAEAANARSER